MASPDRSALHVNWTVSPVPAIVNTDRIAALLDHAARKRNMAGELGIWICTDAEVADLHLRFMGISGPTDVITFPNDDPMPGAYVGDIAVSAETAAEQAVDAGHPPEREIAFLCLHGLLHLAGFDDLEDHARREMIRFQEAFLDEFEREYPGRWQRDDAG